MNILVLGNSEDAHATHIINVLTQLGINANYLDTSLFPTKLRMSWRPDTELGHLSLPEGSKFKLQDIHSVFWRHFSDVYVPPLEDATQELLAYNDSMSVIITIIKACPARWVNSWEAYQFHKEKPLQLNKVKRQGVNIPQTLVSNDPQQIIEFTQTHKKTIFKPVYGGAHTQFVTESHLDPKRLNLALSISPITVQEYIPGTNIRSYVIAESIYSAEIRSQNLDFREDVNAELIPTELPEVVKQQCFAIAKALMLEWTAIDWRLTPDNNYVFLEANPSPMFLYFEQQTGFPITKELINLLIN